MKEQEIRKLMQESIVAPSDKFSSELMRQIELENSTVKNMRRVPILLSLACLVILVLLAAVSLPGISMLGYSLTVPPIFIHAVGVLFLLYEIHQIIEIYRNLAILKETMLHSSL